MGEYTYSAQRERREMLLDDILSEVLARIDAADEHFHGKGVEVAILQALLEQNELLQAIRRKIDRIMLNVEEINKSKGGTK